MLAQIVFPRQCHLWLAHLKLGISIWIQIISVKLICDKIHCQKHHINKKFIELIQESHIYTVTHLLTPRRQFTVAKPCTHVIRKWNEIQTWTVSTEYQEPYSCEVVIRPEAPLWSHWYHWAVETVCASVCVCVYVCLIPDTEADLSQYWFFATSALQGELLSGASASLNTTDQWAFWHMCCMRTLTHLLKKNTKLNTHHCWNPLTAC